MNRAALALTALVASARHMIVEQGRCCALVIDGDRGRLHCAIHDMRPDCCRWLERGSAECLRQLEEKRALALAALERRTSNMG